METGPVRRPGAPSAEPPANRHPAEPKPSGPAPAKAPTDKAAGHTGPGSRAPEHSVPGQRTPDHQAAEHQPADHRAPEHHTADDNTATHHHNEDGATAHNPHEPTEGHHPLPEHPLAESRPHDVPGGLQRVDPHHQQDLESRVPRNPDGTPQRHPDPNGDWPGAINGPGHREPGRNNNCLDVALSTADTYNGHPTAAAARSHDGTHEGEHGGRDRAEQQLGAKFRDLGNGEHAYRNLEDQLRGAGHGSQAVIITQDAHGRAHAWNAVNHHGKITYLDNQTGARSPHPIHDGKHGVWAIPLNADRHPLPAHHEPSPQLSEHSPERRAPAEPASHPVRGSAEFDEKQAKDHQHLGMLPEESQVALRDSEERHVSQMDLEKAYHALDEWERDGDLGKLLDDAALRGREADPKNNHVPRGFSHSDLKKALPGFDEMPSAERCAIVAVLGRMSLGFHRGNAVNHVLGDADHYVVDESGAKPEKGESWGVHYHARADMRGGLAGKKPDPARATFNHLEETYGADTEGKSYAQHVRETDGRNEHRPDFTGRNFAVLEVYDPVSKETHYVVDSSIPQGNANQNHSEPHIGNYFDAVNKQRIEAGLPELDPVHLYTEREPCGATSGSLTKSDCSHYIVNSESLSHIPVSYGVGFRRGQLASDPVGESLGKRKVQTELSAQFKEHLSRIGDLWMRASAKRQGILLDTES
ncbi:MULTISPECIES: toxin glutamine deamidase domain-containing protein [Kitasatospora]|uniref:toxin glutamine deamidase domain-containing protein n=1 Tax=Kitasatospora TaxID=2063 RepID=UPI0031D74EB6